jgi:hypothetical protein
MSRCVDQNLTKLISLPYPNLKKSISLKEELSLC